MSDNASDLAGRVVSVVADILQVDPSTVDLEAPFAELGFDSLALTTFLVTIEDQFEVEFADNELDRLYATGTGADALRVLEEFLASRSGASASGS